MSAEFWYFLLEGEYDRDTGVFGSFFAHGAHCGEALHFACEAAAAKNFLNPRVVEAERLDILADYVPPDDVLKVTKMASIKPNVHTYLLDGDDQQFVPPIGIVKSTKDGEYDYSLIVEGFVAYTKDKNGFFEFELVAGIDKLVDTFLQAIQFLPRMELFYLYLTDFWEAGGKELWESSTISDKNDVLTFLTRHRTNTAENGYVECVVQESYGSALPLDDHKKIQFRTSDERLFSEFGKRMMTLGF